MWACKVSSLRYEDAMQAEAPWDSRSTAHEKDFP